MPPVGTVPLARERLHPLSRAARRAVDVDPDASTLVLPAVALAASAEPAAAAAPGQPAEPRPELVRLEGVSRSFAGTPEVLALRDVDLVISQGDYISIMGPSGSGKSTLLNVLGLLDRPTVGRYLLAGRDTAPLKDRDRTRLRGQTLGFVFQAFHLLARRTVLENVMLSMTYCGVPRSQRRGRAWEALEQVSMTHRANFYPTTLSGGERQRTAVARAVAARPKLLLADEPTGNLDSATSGEVLEMLEGLNRAGLAVAVVTHDPQVAAVARRRVRMQDGRLEETTAVAP
ncbi:MAG: ABC transporter ATP-binding protein [Bifidobacteriaceae bacterium]|jgi:putative ABC transport system ATP-binding protein|nr:ABC transporter ATP-binding protein [Bifidobacteriaceae bacterium]